MNRADGSNVTLGRLGLGSFRTMAAVAFVLSLVLGVVPQAGASHDDDDDNRRKGKKVQISGDSTPSDCNHGEGLGGLLFTGDMEGCLIILAADGVCQEVNGFALYEEAGTELFKGEIFGDYGTFRTTYTLEATYLQGSCDAINAALAGEGEFPFDRQLTGGCDHKIKGRTGAFKGARGLIVLHDVIPDPGVSGASNFFWEGDIRLKR